MDKNAATERKLSSLFDYQHFEGNERLTAMHADVMKRYSQPLTDDTLELASAAGVPNVPPQDGEKQ